MTRKVRPATTNGPLMTYTSVIDMIPSKVSITPQNSTTNQEPSLQTRSLRCTSDSDLIHNCHVVNTKQCPWQTLRSTWHVSSIQRGACSIIPPFKKDAEVCGAGFGHTVQSGCRDGSLRTEGDQTSSQKKSECQLTSESRESSLRGERDATGYREGTVRILRWGLPR